jgi:hypothetical protein
MIPDTTYIILQYNNNAKLRTLNKDWYSKYTKLYTERCSEINQATNSWLGIRAQLKKTPYYNEILDNLEYEVRNKISKLAQKYTECYNNYYKIFKCYNVDKYFNLEQFLRKMTVQYNYSHEMRDPGASIPGILCEGSCEIKMQYTSVNFEYFGEGYDHRDIDYYTLEIKGHFENAIASDSDENDPDDENDLDDSNDSDDSYNKFNTNYDILYDSEEIRHSDDVIKPVYVKNLLSNDLIIKNYIKTIILLYIYYDKCNRDGPSIDSDIHVPHIFKTDQSNTGNIIKYLERYPIYSVFNDKLRAGFDIYEHLESLTPS